MNYRERIFNLLIESLELNEGSMGSKRLNRVYNSKKLDKWRLQDEGEAREKTKVNSIKYLYKDKQRAKKLFGKIKGK